MVVAVGNFGSVWLLSLERLAAAVAPSHVSRELKRGAQYSDLNLDWPENPFPNPRIKTTCWEEYHIIVPCSARAAVSFTYTGKSSNDHLASLSPLLTASRRKLSQACSKQTFLFFFF